MDIRKLSMQNTLTCKSHLLNKTDMRRKLFFITLLLLFPTLSARADLQEDSLKNFLSVLRHELNTQHLEQTKQHNKSNYVNE